MPALASYAADFLPHSPLVPEHLRAQLPEDTLITIDALRHHLGQNAVPLAGWAQAVTQLRTASIHEKTQQHWQDKIYSKAMGQLKESVPQRDRCRLALQTPHTAAWLTCTPQPAAGNELDHCNFKLGLQWWLGLPILPPEDIGEKCGQCGACLDAFGDHAVACLKNGITQRHTALQDWLIHAARQAGVTCTKEGALPDNDRPADVLLHNWTGSTPLAVDLTVCHPLRPSEARPTPESVRKAMTLQETHKCTKYSERCARVGWKFQPLVIHPFGGLTIQGTQLFHRLSRLFAENSTMLPTKGERVQLFWQTFSITVMRQVTNQLRLTTYTGPQGPVLPHVWPMDAFGNEIAVTSKAVKRPRPAQGTRQDSVQQHIPYA